MADLNKAENLLLNLSSGLGFEELNEKEKECLKEYLSEEKYEKLKDWDTFENHG